MQKYLTAVEVLSLHARPESKAPYVSQSVYGQSVKGIVSIGTWTLVETAEGYRGYALSSGLVPDRPEWRMSPGFMRTQSIASLVYPEPCIEGPALLRLPFDARVVVEQRVDARWVQVALLDGSQGWMQSGDLDELEPKDLQCIPQLALQFQHLPYIWGGTSSQGFDCSGYIQTLFKQAGVLLPRDSSVQAESGKMQTIDSPQDPGDVLFFGEENISHVGLYLGERRCIHAGVRQSCPKIRICTIEESGYSLVKVRRVSPPAYQAQILPVPEGQIFCPKENPVSSDRLRRLELSYWGFDGCVHEGELIVHCLLADEVIEVFQELFALRYPIEEMVAIDRYGGEDSVSCEENNTSSFCSRKAIGKQTWSDHSFGRAIDLNPLVNPYCRQDQVIPVCGKTFLDRSLSCRGMIQKGDPVHQAFVKRGWQWGGDWLRERGYVDWQHFYKSSND